MSRLRELMERGGVHALLLRRPENFAWYTGGGNSRVEYAVRAVDQILERMRVEVTRPGRSLAEAFAECRRFYAEAGFPEEWGSTTRAASPATRRVR